MDKNNQTIQRADSSASIDTGLREHMMSVYNYMTIGLIITAIAAGLAIYTPLINMFFTVNGQYIKMSGLGYIILFAPLAFVFGINYALSNATLQTVKTMFFAFSAVMGLSLAPTLYFYTGESITQVFLITAATFGAMSLYGYTTKKSLTGIGSFLMMGLFGIIIAMIVNIFLGSETLSFGISILAVLIFTGLAAYDTQAIRNSYNVNDTADTSARKVVVGALNIYLDFINIFIHLLRLIGDRR